jgi:hypothetical protein
MKKSSVDADAQAFITAAAITNATQQTAINTLVISLKSYGIWTKMKALYPFVGGTAASHKFNLKDPRDLNAAFRLIFNGGWTHSSNGVVPNGTNGYADTYFNPNNFNQDNLAFGSYLRNTGSYNCYIGAFDTYRTYLLPVSTSYYGQINSSGFAFTTITASQTTKLHLITRTTATTASIYINGTLLFNDNIPSNGKTNRNIWIGALNNAAASPDYYYSTNQQAFSFIADGLNSTEITNLTNIVQAYQTSLSRQV